jgi:hypothetical protein
MIPKWFNCGECFYFKPNTKDSEDGRCFYNILSEEVITIHFCSRWACKRCFEHGISSTNHQTCEVVTFEREQMVERALDSHDKEKQ